MDLRRLKDQKIGMGVRRFRYEQRLDRLIEKDMLSIGDQMGLNQLDAIMLAEIMEYKVYSTLLAGLKSGEIFVFSDN